MIRKDIKNNVNKWRSASINILTYNYYFDYLSLITMNRFSWENLPTTINRRYMEKIMLTRGTGVFFKDDNEQHRFLGYSQIGGLNMYGEPVKLMSYTANGRIFKHLYPLNSVIMYDNDLRISLLNYISFYAEKLMDIDQTIQINLKAQKTPIILVCSEEQRASMRNMYKEYDGNEPVIRSSKMPEHTDFKVLKTDAPYIADKLIVDKQKIFNEFCTFIGINNTNSEKKERMITDEVNANNGLVEMGGFFGLTPRLETLEKYNNIFGTNFNCKMKTATVTGDTVEFSEVNN